MFFGLLLSTVLGIGFKDYRESRVREEAIKNGYEQVVEDGQTLWRKTTDVTDQK